MIVSLAAFRTDANRHVSENHGASEMIEDLFVNMRFIDCAVAEFTEMGLIGNRSVSLWSCVIYAVHSLF